MSKNEIIDNCQYEIDNDYYGEEDDSFLNMEINNSQIVQINVDGNQLNNQEKHINSEWLLDNSNYCNDDLDQKDLLLNEDYYDPIELLENKEEDKIITNVPKIECNTSEIYYKSRSKPQQANFIIGINVIYFIEI